VGEDNKNRVTLIYIRDKGFVYKHTHSVYKFNGTRKKNLLIVKGALSDKLIFGDSMDTYLRIGTSIWLL
jgi:hypothetical protein